MPFPAGVSTDIAARILAEKMATSLKQAIVIENRAGAAGATGIKAVAGAPPDGYMLGVSGVGTSAILESLGRNLGFSPATDLAYIGHMGSSALVIAGRTDLGAKSFADFVTLAKSKPDAFTYGSPGHLAMKLLIGKAGIKVRHLP